MEHAAGVEGVAGGLAGAPRVGHAAVLAVAHQRRCSCTANENHTNSQLSASYAWKYVYYVPVQRWDSHARLHSCGCTDGSSRCVTYIYPHVHACIAIHSRWTAVLKCMHGIYRGQTDDAESPPKMLPDAAGA